MTQNAPKLPPSTDTDTPDPVNPITSKMAEKLARFMERMDRELGR